MGEREIAGRSFQVAGETKLSGIVQVREAGGIAGQNSTSSRKHDGPYPRLILIPGYFSEVIDAGIVMIEGIKGDLMADCRKHLGKIIRVFSDVNDFAAGVDIKIGQ